MNKKRSIAWVDSPYADVFKRIAEVAIRKVSSKAELTEESYWHGRIWILGRIMFHDCVDNDRAHGMIRIGFELTNSYSSHVTIRDFDAREPNLIVFQVPDWIKHNNPETKISRKDRRLILNHYIGIKRERDAYVAIMDLKGEISSNVTIVGCNFSKRKDDISRGVDLWIRCHVHTANNQEEVRIGVDVKGPKHRITSFQGLKANLIVCDERRDPLSKKRFVIPRVGINNIALAAQEKANQGWVNQKIIQSRKN